MTRNFAKVLEVTAKKISCEITTNQLPFNFNGEIYDLKSVGSLVSLYDSFNHYTLIYQVVRVYEKEQVYNSNDFSKIKNSILFDAIPLAEMTLTKVDFGVNIFPIVKVDDKIPIIAGINFPTYNTNHSQERSAVVCENERGIFYD